VFFVNHNIYQVQPVSNQFIMFEIKNVSVVVVSDQWVILNSQVQYAWVLGVAIVQSVVHCKYFCNFFTIAFQVGSVTSL